MFEGVGADLADVHKLIQSYALCLDKSSNNTPASLLVLKTNGEYFTLSASDPMMTVTTLSIQPDNGTHKAWKLFTSEDDLRAFIVSKTDEYEAIMKSGGNVTSDERCVFPLGYYLVFTRILPIQTGYSSTLSHFLPFISFHFSYHKS